MSDKQTETLYKKLLERLPEARILRAVHPQNPGRKNERFDVWSCGVHVFIVHVYGEGRGAEVYIPGTRANSIGAVVERIANLVKEDGEWPSTDRRKT